MIISQKIRIKIFKMSLKKIACEDLKAFERRLTEIIAHSQPQAIRWRVVLAVVSVCVAVGAWHWLRDPNTATVSFIESLWFHPLFSLSCICLVGVFLGGIHRRVVAPTILANRTRNILTDFNMDCEDEGKIILKSWPTIH